MNIDYNKRSKNTMYHIIGILLLCIGLISLFSSTTLSWLKDSSTTSNGEPNIAIIGTLSLDVTTNFNFYNLALAPDKIYTTDALDQDIATYVKTSAEHDIDGAYVRIKFENTRYNPSTSSYIDNFDLLDLYFDGNITTQTSYSASAENKWFYNSVDNFYYYIGGVYGTNVMFNRGYRTTNIFTNDVADLNVHLKFTIDAIQRQYGASADVWTTAPNVFKGYVVQDTTVNVINANVNVVVNGSTLASNTILTGKTVAQALNELGITEYNDSNTCGWYADENLTIPLSSDTIITENMSLYTKPADLDKITTTGTGSHKTLTTVNKTATGQLILPNDIETIGQVAFEDSKFTSIVIPSSVKTIQYLAINNSKLKSLHIPANVTSINNFLGSPPSLETITCDSANPVYRAVNNCLIEKSNKTIQLGCKNSVIPSDSSIVTKIGEHVWHHNTATINLNIPPNIAKIEGGGCI